MVSDVRPVECATTHAPGPQRPDCTAVVPAADVRSCVQICLVGRGQPKLSAWGPVSI